MSQMRVQTGEEIPPPLDLHDRPLPLLERPESWPLHRVHRSIHSPVFFGPGAGKPPAFRFDSNTGAFGVLYAAEMPDGAFVETLLRNPSRLMVDWSEIAARSYSELLANKDLRLVDATGSGLSRLGTTAALSTGPYDPCGLWSDALFHHPEQPDGIIYSSRHNPKKFSIALFGRPDMKLSVLGTVPLTEMLDEVAEFLDRHGKSIAGLP